MSTLLSDRPQDAVRFPARRASLVPVAFARDAQAARRAVAAAGRCLGVAALACILTRPLFHAPNRIPQSRSVEAPVSVTADISRRLSASDAGPANHPEDLMHWAGMSER